MKTICIKALLLLSIISCSNSTNKRIVTDNASYNVAYLPKEIGDTISYIGNMQYTTHYKNEYYDTLYVTTAQIVKISSDSFRFQYNAVYYKQFEPIDNEYIPELEFLSTYADYKIHEDSSYHEAFSALGIGSDFLFKSEDSIYYKCESTVPKFRDDKWVFRGKKIQ